jgi:1,4-alpha-glucan branching enzyme
MLADRFAADCDAPRERILNQAARELLLAQSSDWAFIMKTGTVVEYAEKRCKEHIHRFLKLAEMCENGGADESRLAEWEAKDNIFDHIDFRVYCSRPGETLAMGSA